MISSEVQRTLVKSPPELWAELSDPAALARHLGEFGEIRITRIDPEQAVEWEAEDASGKVQIKASAWGTRVTLTVTRQVPAPDAPPASEPPAQSEETAEAEPEPTAHTEPDPVSPVEAEPAPAAQTEGGPSVAHPAQEPPHAVAATATVVESGTEAGTEAEVEATVEPTAEPERELLPRRGFFSRLFGRRRARAAPQLDPAGSRASAPSPSEPPASSTAGEPQPTESGETTPTWESQFGSPETAAGVGWQPQPNEMDAGLELQPPQHIETHAGEQPPPAGSSATDPIVEEPHPAPADAASEQADEPAASADAAPREISEELEAAQETAAEETAAALTAVLDRLGAAHHRPFSRG